MKNKTITTHTIFPYFQKNGLKINYKKGHQFFRPEDSAQGIYYLESGQAILTSSKTNGAEQILAIGEAGSIFGKVGSVMTQPTVNIAAQSMTDCVVYRLGCQEFMQLIRTEPLACSAYMQQVSYNNVYLLSQVLILGEKDIYTRIITELLFLAKFHGEQIGKTCTLRINLTQEDLANMLCISREYLNKTLQKIKQKKLLSNQKGQIIIPSLIALKKEING